MISTTKELLLSAEKTNSAVAALTCYNAETLQAAITAVKKLIKVLL